MAIKSTMGLKFAEDLWAAMTAAVGAGVSASTFIDAVLTEFRGDPVGVWVDAVSRAMGQPAPLAGELKKTSCSVAFANMVALHDAARKLEMPREAVLRLLVRRYLEKLAEAEPALAA